MSPITGPFSDLYYSSVDGTGSRSEYKRWFRQKPPFNAALAYTHSVAHTTAALRVGDWPPTTFGGVANSANQHGDTYAHSWFNSVPNMGDEIKLTRNLARARFVDILNQGATASWGINIAQWRQAADMFHGVAKTLTLFSQAVRRADFKASYRALFSTSPPAKGGKYSSEYQRRWRAKSFASRYLEFHFGWEPLYKDIFDTVEIFTKPVKVGHVAGSATRRHSLQRILWPSADVTQENTHTGIIRVKVGALVSVENPNLVLAQRLGLLNPASIAWDAVPWSFVVDWWGNVGNVIASLTDLSGFGLKEAYTSTKIVDVCRSYSVSRAGPSFPWVGSEVYSTGQTFYRELGVPGVALLFRKPWSTSVTRALTASSLLIQKGVNPNIIHKK